MAKYDWEPTEVHVSLHNKKALRDLKNPLEGSSDERLNCTRFICSQGHLLGFDSKLSFEQKEKKNYRFRNDGLVLAEHKPYYALTVAAFNKNQAFEEYSWKVVGETSQRRANGDVDLTTTLRFQQQHPYEGPVDSVMLYERLSQEGDCGPDPLFEAFFFEGKLVAGWDYDHEEKKPLRSYRGLANVLNGLGSLVHPSQQQVKEFLRESNLPRTTLTRFEEML